MLSLLWSFSSFLLQANFVQVMISISLILPFCMSLTYKSFFYSEDLIFMFTPLGFSLIFLTLSLMGLVLVASKESSDKYYVKLQGSLVIALILCFSVNNLLAFYIMFETCLIPILLLIINWGYQPERLQASTYMVVYTVISSLPLLVIIMYIYADSGTYHILSLCYFMYKGSLLLLVGLLAFLVKLPMYGLHVWLPKAHVEAPLGGSMVLAGVLLKLGGYGLYLYNSLFNFSWGSGLGCFVLLISLWGGVLSCLACASQVDIKALIAYSSVVHMSMIVFGLLGNSSWGLASAMVIMVAHGWASSGLFLLAFFTYQLVGSRSFSYSKGLLTLMPTLGVLWFGFCMINMGFPPSINFLGEVLIVPAVFMHSWKVFICVGLIMFLSCAYNMYLYSQINHGALSSYVITSSSPLSRTLLSLVGHMFPMMFILNMWVISYN